MRRLKKWTALFCAVMMTASFLTGCGDGGSGSDVSGDGGAAPEPEKKTAAATEEENAEKSMGRYLEREVALPEEMTETGMYLIPYMNRLESGDLMLAERTMGKYISSDDGGTWESAGCPWRERTKETYVTEMAISPAGAVAMVGFPKEENRDDGAELVYEYYYVDTEGQETKLEFADGTEFRRFGFDRENRLYGMESGGKVYRIDETDGSKKELFTADSTVDFACFTDKYMVGITVQGGAVVYDISQDVLMDTDEVLQNFIKDNLGLSIGGTDVGHSVVLTAGEQEDVVYFAFKGGLYRHVIGGTVIEQIIDGTTSTFGDPSATLMDMTLLPDNEFMVLYTDMKLYRYTYNPNVPTIPEKQLKIYSLKESVALRQAVSMYQKSHEDVFIRYEIGMSGEDGVTREDAIRNLNTKMMSGDGPDIMLLDGLPQASYEEKGILADVSGLVDEMSGDAALFPNIVETCKKDGKIYALPVRIELPVIAGSAADVAKVQDLESLASMLEELREQNPEGALLNMRSPEMFLYILRMSSSAAWTDESGDIDEKALEEFLTAAKRIWDAEAAGVDAEKLVASDGGYGSLNSELVNYYGNMGTGAENVAAGFGRFAIGKVTAVDFEYDMAMTLREMGYDIELKAWNGQVKNGYMPVALAGITANSIENETAVDFYRYLFGKEQQDMSTYSGLPVNMASFEGLRNNPRAGLVEDADERYAGSISTSSPDGGDIFGVELMWPTEEDFEKLKAMVEAVSCVSIGDAVIEDTVYEVGVRVLDGGITPADAAAEIVKKVAIYLAE